MLFHVYEKLIRCSSHLGSTVPSSMYASNPRSQQRRHVHTSKHFNRLRSRCHHGIIMSALATIRPRPQVSVIRRSRAPQAPRTYFAASILEFWHLAVDLVSLTCRGLVSMTGMVHELRRSELLLPS